MERRLRPERPRKPVFIHVYEDQKPLNAITGVTCTPGGITIHRQGGETIADLLARAPRSSLVIVAQYDDEATEVTVGR